MLKQVFSLANGKFIIRKDFRECESGECNSIERVWVLFEILIRKDMVFNAPLFAQKFSYVVSDAVLENADDSLCFVIFPSLVFNEFKRRVKDCSWWSTYQKTLLPHKVSCKAEWAHIFSFHPIVDRLPCASPRDEVVADSLYFVRSSREVEFSWQRQNTTNRVSTHDKCIWTPFFDFPRNSGNSSSSSCP